MVKAKSAAISPQMTMSYGSDAVPGPFLEGRMDEVRISNIARSEQEIKELMNKGIEGVLAVKPQDKLATTWGKLKSHLAQ